MMQHGERHQLIVLAARHGLPAIFEQRESALAGGSNAGRECESGHSSNARVYEYTS